MLDMCSSNANALENVAFDHRAKVQRDKEGQALHSQSSCENSNSGSFQSTLSKAAKALKERSQITDLHLFSDTVV
jgi:hypothetical protein